MESYESVMTRKDVSDNIVEITHDAGGDRWLVIRKMLDAGKISLQVIQMFHLFEKIKPNS